MINVSVHLICHFSGIQLGFLLSSLLRVDLVTCMHSVHRGVLNVCSSGISKLFFLWSPCKGQPDDAKIANWGMEDLMRAAFSKLALPCCPSHFSTHCLGFTVLVTVLPYKLSMHCSKAMPRGGKMFLCKLDLTRSYCVAAVYRDCERTKHYYSALRW